MQGNKRRTGKKYLRVFLVVVILLIALVLLFRLIVTVKPPEVKNNIPNLKREIIGEDFYKIENNWLRKNNSGLWEMYISGKPFERGLKNGILAKELVHKQEVAFVKLIKELIPNNFYLKFLKYFVAWFNKDLNEFIPVEYQKEIYGISLNASNDFKFIGDGYHRLLNYHAAHDIGHALQNLNLVACTSFGLWDEFSSDSSLLIGRNFDFHAGDDFVKDKIVLFVKPNDGYEFAIITWGGFIGAVSGMNMKGLTVTINAAKSDIPFGAKTPVSIVAREILQYAANIDEAFQIAKNNKTFVSETFLIGSAADNCAYIIEKSLDTTVLYKQDINYIIGTNHFQDKAFTETKLNIENRENETSVYRYSRVEELLNKSSGNDFVRVAQILRDQKGLNDRDIGMTNEKSINQLIAHHSVIFKPEERLIWVSTHPCQLGKYVCYDLNKVFSLKKIPAENEAIICDSLEIDEDPFSFSEDYNDFLYYKDFVNKTKSNDFENITETELEKFIGSNPEFYFTYEKAGDYFQFHQNAEKSLEYYNFALRKEVSSKMEREKIFIKLKGRDTGN